MANQTFNYLMKHQMMHPSVKDYQIEGENTDGHVHLKADMIDTYLLTESMRAMCDHYQTEFSEFESVTLYVNDVIYQVHYVENSITKVKTVLLTPKKD